MMHLYHDTRIDLDLHVDQITSATEMNRSMSLRQS